MCANALIGGFVGVFDRRLTFKVDLPGGQDRLRQMILYVSIKSQDTPRFGRIKLNKILWKSDFDAYAARGVPVTGCAYQRLRLGPAPRAMLPLLMEMLQVGLLREEIVDFGDGIEERRPVALEQPNMSYFSDDDLTYVGEAMRYYWPLTGMETSDDSHGLAWQTRSDREPMPYQSALLSDRPPGPKQMRRLKDRIRSQGLQSE